MVTASCRGVNEIFPLGCSQTCSSVCPFVRVYKLHSNWIDYHEILYCGFYENLWRNRNFFKSCRKLLSTLREDLIKLYFWQRCSKCSTKALLRSTWKFLIVESDAYFSNTQRMHCCVSIAKVVRLKRHDAALSYMASVAFILGFHLRKCDVIIVSWRERTRWNYMSWVLTKSCVSGVILMQNLTKYCHMTFHVLIV